MKAVSSTGISHPALRTIAPAVVVAFMSPARMAASKSKGINPFAKILADMEAKEAGKQTEDSKYQTLADELYNQAVRNAASQELNRALHAQTHRAINAYPISYMPQFFGPHGPAPIARAYANYAQAVPVPLVPVPQGALQTQYVYPPAACVRPTQHPAAFQVAGVPRIAVVSASPVGGAQPVLLPPIGQVAQSTPAVAETHAHTHPHKETCTHTHRGTCTPGVEQPTASQPAVAQSLVGEVQIQLQQGSSLQTQTPVIRGTVLAQQQPAVCPSVLAYSQAVAKQNMLRVMAQLDAENVEAAARIAQKIQA